MDNLELKTMNELLALKSLKCEELFSITEEICKRDCEYKEVENMSEQSNAHGNNINKVSNMLNKYSEDQ